MLLDTQHIYTRNLAEHVLAQHVLEHFLNTILSATLALFV